MNNIANFQKRYGDDYVRKADKIGIEMRKTDGAGLNYRDKYYALRRTAKELIFENSAYQAEILECQKMVCYLYCNSKL